MRVEVYRDIEYEECFHIDNIEKIYHGKFYHLHEKDLTNHALKKKIKKIAEYVLYDPLIESLGLKDEDKIKQDFDFVLEVSWRVGVTDNTASSLMEILEDYGLNNVKATSGKLYFIKTSFLKCDEIEQLGREYFFNDLIQKIRIFNYKEFFNSKRFFDFSFPIISKKPLKLFERIDLSLTSQRLEELSTARCLALNVLELQTIRNHFFPLSPTDVELEILAQTWSEHCKHKIFSAEIEYIEEPHTKRPLGNKKIFSLYKTYIQDTTTQIREGQRKDWAISVFTDNAGIVRFDPRVDLCIKVETHNSPSALDPYGGSLTGILGVNRDILGCGMGARPIANMNVFCLPPPGWPIKGQEGEMPQSLKPFRQMLEGVHRGVEDGGNKSGIPTVNGAFYFDESFVAKPLVFVGTVGVMPAILNNGKSSAIKSTEIGDHIFMIGGDIGADGIHGATFSSLALNENFSSSPVQIGDPFTQKRMIDFVLEARDEDLFTGITDNGAGGLSSSVGEMALMTNGATIDLALAPVKYPGLLPFELMISESQERMTLSVHPSKTQQFLKLALKRGVKASDLGAFTNSGFLEVYYNEEKVAKLDLNFLHKQVPLMKLKASWSGNFKRISFCAGEEKRVLSQGKITRSFIEKSLLELLSRPNIVSKKSWIERYDHEVQAATHIKPFMGKTAKGPNDSAVIWLYPHGGNQDSGISIGCGMNARLSLYDPYMMAVYAVDEAVRNVVATGGDPDRCCLLDNFCWPDPLVNSENLGALVRTCEGLKEICLAYETPLVSGKDSMKNNFNGQNKKGENISIDILPMLLVTALSATSMRATCTSHFKSAGDAIYILGWEKNATLLCSEFRELYHGEDEDLPSFNFKNKKELYRYLHLCMQENIIRSCHDISEGGVLCALSESLFGDHLGAKIDVSILKDNFLVSFFNEMAGQFIVSVKWNERKKFENYFYSHQFLFLGSVCKDPYLTLTDHNEKIVHLSTEDLLNAWSKEF